MYSSRLGELQATAPTAAVATGQEGSWFTQFTRGFVMAAAPAVGLRTMPAVTLTPAPLPATATVWPAGATASAMPGWVMPAVVLGGLGIVGVLAFSMMGQRRRR